MKHIIDLLESAKIIADKNEEKLISYLITMALIESKSRAQDKAETARAA